MPRQLIKLAIWCVFWTAIALFGYGAIREKRRITTPPATTADPVQTLMREQDQRFELNRRRKEIDEQLHAKLGALPGSAFKHPDLSIGQALHLAAQSSAPLNARAHVSVDRFSEFTITISRDPVLTTNEMAATSIKLLPHAAAYTHALRFAHGEKVIAELDRADIEFIEDWSRALPDRVAMLLPRESEAPAGVATEQLQRERQIIQLIQSDPDLRPKLTKAQEEFFAAARKANDDLRAAIDGSEEALDVSSDPKPNYIKRLDQLRAAGRQANAARGFYADSPGVWKAALQSSAVTAEAIDQLAQMGESFLRHDRAKMIAVLDALDAKLESARYVLQALEDQKRPAATASALESTDTSDQVRRALEQLRADNEALNRALRSAN